MRRYNSVFAIAAGALAVACSGDNGPGAMDLPEAVVAGRPEHGTIRSIGANTNAAITPGDDGNGVAYRSTLGFDLGALPSGARVTAAMLDVAQCQVGGNAFGALGPLVLDHIDLTLGLTDAAYGGQTLESNIGTISSTTGTGSRTLDVTTAVQADMSASRRVTAFRLRFRDHDTNADAVADFVQIALSRDQHCIDQPDPRLHVSYDR